MISYYVNMKLKIMQNHGKIVILTSFPIQLSHSKETRLPLLKLMSCIATSSSLPLETYMLG